MRHTLFTGANICLRMQVCCAAEQMLIIDLDLAVRPAGLNGTLLLGNGGSVDGISRPDRWAEAAWHGLATLHGAEPYVCMVAVVATRGLTPCIQQTSHATPLQGEHG